MRSKIAIPAKFIPAVSVAQHSFHTHIANVTCLNVEFGVSEGSGYFGVEGLVISIGIVE